MTPQDFNPRQTACTSFEQSLPWFLNGTLADQEAGEMLAHLESCDGCRRELQRVEQAAELLTAHLPTMTLAEFALGLDTEIPAQEVEAHLSMCAQCRQELAMVQMDTETEIVDFAAARKAREQASPVERPQWSRLAVAAGLGAVLGSSLIVGRLADSEITTIVQQQEPAAIEVPSVEVDSPEQTLFSDGFESGTSQRWQMVVEDS